MAGRWVHKTNPGLWVVSGWWEKSEVYCPWRNPAVWSQVLSPRNLVSRSETVDEVALWVPSSSFAVQVIHTDMSAASQHCFETASWLRTHIIPVILYSPTCLTTKKKTKNFLSKPMSQEHKSTNCCCLSSYCLLVKKFFRKYFFRDI